MIETIAVLVATFAVGFWTGHQNPTVSCLDQPLITSTCVELTPPSDESFGATSTSLIEAVTTYRKCKAACTASAK